MFPHPPRRAGETSVYQSTCGGDGTATACYIDNVINNGTAQYANAYFELNYIRAFAANSSAVVNANGSAVTSGAGAPTTTAPASGSGSGFWLALLTVLILTLGAAGNFLAPISGLSENAFKTVIEIDTVRDSL